VSAKVARIPNQNQAPEVHVEEAQRQMQQDVEDPIQEQSIQLEMSSADPVTN
jgi:hypothetical protein